MPPRYNRSNTRRDSQVSSFNTEASQEVLDDEDPEEENKDEVKKLDNHCAVKGSNPAHIGQPTSLQAAVIAQR